MAFVIRWFDGITPTMMKTAPAHLIYGIVQLQRFNKVSIAGV